MSPRRWFGGALLLAALGMTSAPRASRAPQIVASVGGNLAGRVGDTLDVPITVDMRGAPGLRLGSYRLTIRWNPNVLWFQTGSNGTFAQPLVNDDSTSYGVMRMTAIQPSGADSIVTLGVGHFVVQSDTGASDITVTFDEMSGIAPTFDDLLPYLTVVNGTFCHAAGRWGDVDGDGQSNSRDALVALSRVVGIALDTTLIVPIDSLHADTLVTLRPGLADVDADGQVTSRDALIIMSYAVGLPVTGFRIGLAAAPGACGSGLGITLAIAPDTLELQAGQTAAAVVSARDGAGAPVSLNGATWTSGNTAVAGVTSPGFGIVARDAGIAVLTAQLGAGIRASMVVKVLAHRSQWYVDVARSQAALQTGSQAFPFAFIQDAFDAGRDGDTVNVASGIYEEMVSSDISVYLRGDPAHWPVIDSRGSPSYYAYSAGLSAGSRAAPMRIENLRIEHGGISISSHDFFARNVHIEASDSAWPALYFYSALGMPPGAPPAGVRPGAADLPNDTGNITLDSVTVHGPWGVSGEAIYVGLADTVIIRNSAVSRDSAFSALYGGYFPACNGSGPAGIKVDEASRTAITNVTVLNAPCVGLEVYQSAGSASISGNTVDRAGGAGIAVSLPVVAFDHNLVTRIISGSSEAQAAGILVYNNTTAQSVTSVGDVIRGSGDRGFLVLGARTAVIDQLTVDTTGLDNTSSSAGVEFWGGHLTLTNSRISNILSYGPGVLAWTPDTAASVLESRHNVITYTGAQGLYATSYTPGYGCAPPFRGAPPVARGALGGCGGKGPDTLISVGDSVLFTGSSAVQGESGVRLFIDSLTVDSISGSYGVMLDFYRSAWIGRSRIAHVSGSSGIYTTGVDTVTVAGSAILSTAYQGIESYDALSTSLVGNTIDSTAGNGVYIYSQYTSSPLLVVDSNRIAASGQNGLSLDCYLCTGVGTLTRNSFKDNAAVGILDDGSSGGFNLTAHRNTITGNIAGGARLTNAVIGIVTMNADTNYWGDASGPACDTSNVTWGCTTSGVGDSVSNGITFADWLTASAADVMPAPRFMAPVAHRAPLIAAAGSTRPAAASVARPAGAAAARNAFTLRSDKERPEAPRAPLMTWRKGQQPRPARVHHPQ